MLLRRKRSAVVLSVLVFVSAGAVLRGILNDSYLNAAAPAGKPDAAKKVDKEEKPALSKFMRQKMQATNDIMEGLLLEDPKLINTAAKKLKEMSDAEHWRVSNDMMYRHHSEDFRSSVDKLIVASKGQSIDRAALAWFDVTLSCIDCHRFVRTVLIAEADSPIPTIVISDRANH